MQALERIIMAMAPARDALADEAGNQVTPDGPDPVSSGEAGAYGSVAQCRQRARDGYIEGRLRTAFALSDLLGPFPIDIQVRNRVVLLTGAVDSEILRDLAIKAARSADGVLGVNCHIQVMTPAPRTPKAGADDFARRFSDACMTAKVKSRLLWNGGFHGLAIDVDAHDGVVTLTGKVHSLVESDLAEQIALLTRGVRQVDNHLSLDHGRATA